MNFTGRKINKQELKIVDENYPNYLLDIIKKFEVIGRGLSLGEEQDVSGLGVEMQWMTVKEQLEEAYECYPGMLVVNRGYYPVGKCLEGSGDPYFINKEDNVLKLYRIYHDAILNDEINESEIDFVCDLKILLELNRVYLSN